MLKTTGFFEGLFEEHELVSDNVKDRESKIAFLTKVIAVVGKCVNRYNQQHAKLYTLERLIIGTTNRVEFKSSSVKVNVPLSVPTHTIAK